MANKSKEPNLIPHDTDEVRIAIAGMGKMGSYHLQALQQLADGMSEEYYKGAVQTQLDKIRICGICDVAPERLKKWPDYDGFADFDRMLDDTKPHIVIITSPTKTHFNLAKKTLQQGIHAFVEKPIVTSKGQIETIRKMTDSN